MEQSSSPATAAPAPRDEHLPLDRLTTMALGREPWRMSPAQLYVGMKGRIPRRTYWLRGVLALLAITLVANALLDIARIGDDIAFWLMIATFAWPCFAVVAKRLHDFGVSAWWLPLLAVGVGLLLKFAFGLSAWLLLANFVFVWFLVMLVAGLPPGTHGPNRFGVDAREALARARINSAH